jgi:translin
MVDPGVEDSLKSIESEMQGVLARREAILKATRDSISICSKAIVHIHIGKMSEANEEISAAGRILNDLRKRAGHGPLARYLASPEAEFVEASSVQSIVLGKPIPGAKELGVSGEGYVMGLLDTIGEVKRLLLDAIMKSRVDTARQYFELMEALYSILSPFAALDHVANGVRRKIDVARMLTEDARGVMAEEARRTHMVSSMRELQASLGKRSTKKKKRRNLGA